MKFKLVPLFAYLCLLPVLLVLGVWQLNRAEEKRALLILQNQQKTSEPLALRTDSPDSVDTFLYKSVTATGHYDSTHQILLDNQVHQGKAGYFVLTPFLLAHGNQAVLINRGWVDLGKSRSLLPDVSVSVTEITLSGRINRFPRVGLKLADEETSINKWPAVVQTVDAPLLSKHLSYSLFNFQIELDTTEPNGFIRHWDRYISMTPEKHVSYAVQWFLLALTLTVLFIKYGIQKIMLNSPQQRNRIYLLLILALCIIPFVAAFWLSSNTQFVGNLKGRTNTGRLITPVITTERSDLLGMDRFSVENIGELKGHWILLNVVPENDCNTACLEAIHKTKQLRIMLNKDLTRTRRAVVFFKEVPSQTIDHWLHDDTVLLKVNPSVALVRKIIEHRRGTIPDGMLLLMDPLGNLMMQYEPGFDPYKVKKDLLHLLQISQIG